MSRLHCPTCKAWSPAGKPVEHRDWCPIYKAIREDEERRAAKTRHPSAAEAEVIDLENDPLVRRIRHDRAWPLGCPDQDCTHCDPGVWEA